MLTADFGYYPHATIYDTINREVHQAVGGIPWNLSTAGEIGVGLLVNEYLEKMVTAMTPYSFVIYNTDGTALIFVDRIKVCQMNPKKSIAYEPRHIKIDGLDDFLEYIDERFMSSEGAVVVRVINSPDEKNEHLQIESFRYRVEEGVVNERDWQDFRQHVVTTYSRFMMWINGVPNETNSIYGMDSGHLDEPES